MTTTTVGLILAFFLPASSFAPCSLPARRLRSHKPNEYHIPIPPQDIITVTYSTNFRATQPSDEESSTEDLCLSTDQIDAIDALVDQRARARAMGDYQLADKIREEIDSKFGSSSSNNNMNNNSSDDDDDDIYHSSSPYVLPYGYRIELTDVPRKLGGGSSWKVVPQRKESIEYLYQNSNRDNGYDRESSVLQLSHQALGLATFSAENNLPINITERHNIVTKALERLQQTGSTELRGRKAADAAFWFALSGIVDDDDDDEKKIENVNENETIPTKASSNLLDALTRISIEELQRFGHKPSCRAKDVMHIVERLFASGLKGTIAQQLAEVAAECLITKGFGGCNTSTQETVIDLLTKGTFDLHSDRPLLWLWRFSIRQRKQRSFLKGAVKQYERLRSNDVKNSSHSSSTRCNNEQKPYAWSEWFDDPFRPLVVDVGCGMGVSLHGLATLPQEHPGREKSYNNDNNNNNNNDLDCVVWSDCNYIGVDLSRLAIVYARSLASRWELTGRLRYAVDSAEDCLRSLSEYPGKIALVMIQFPTPYRLQQPQSDDDNDNDDDHVKPKGEQTNNHHKGNRQLPKHPYEGFMVTKELLCIAHEALLPRTTQEGTEMGGKLLLQSNCEDVAVYMKKLATERANFGVVPAQIPRTSFDNSQTRIPQRTVDYLNMEGGGGDDVARALGGDWSAVPLLPRRGATETEVACFLETTPVHRCLLEARTEQRSLTYPKL